MMKAWILIYILSGEPVMLADYATQTECTDVLSAVKLVSSNADAALHRCLARADYEAGLALAERREFLIWKHEGN
jgi:hypothetical protein